MDSANKTKRIAKNTVLLYLRMVIVMFITLFTSRIVLRELGIGDYGIYNVVGGIVSMFAFLKSSMSSSTQRFLSYELGKKSGSDLKNIFSICLTSHILIAFVLLVLSETLGLWFVNSQINIPESRMVSMNWIFQFSIFALCIDIISIPFNADIISNEKMGIFALLGVLEAVLKLVIAYLITISPLDKLVFYGLLMMCIPIIICIINIVYCRIHFPESHYRFFWDRNLFKRVFSFSGWTIWGQLAIVGSNQGTNVLVNIFHSVAANAAMGVGHQVNSALTGLVSNFQTAFKPQITKSYAEQDYEYLNKLSVYSSKISFSLLFLASLPIVLNIDFVLDVWLDTVPKYAGELCIIFIWASLFNAISAPLWMTIFASGRIKHYQICMSVAYLIELFIVYILFKIGCSLYVGVGMKAILNVLVILIRVYYTKREVNQFDIVGYLKKAILPLLVMAILIYVAAVPLINSFQSIGIKLGVTVVVELLAVVSFFFLGLSPTEKQSIFKIIKK